MYEHTCLWRHNLYNNEDFKNSVSHVLHINDHQPLSLFSKTKSVLYTICVKWFFSSGRTTFQILVKLSNGKNVAKHLICGNKGLYSNSMAIEGVHLVVCPIKVWRAVIWTMQYEMGYIALFIISFFSFQLSLDINHTPGYSRKWSYNQRQSRSIFFQRYCSLFCALLKNAIDPTYTSRIIVHGFCLDFTPNYGFFFTGILYELLYDYPLWRLHLHSTYAVKRIKSVRMSHQL